jgi:dTDP-4-amino-4,6-dideoxygalactose transaminase
VPKIPFLDISAQNRSIWPELQAAMESVASNSQFILGPAVERFEERFARYLGVKHCVGLNNGTSALHMALRAFDVGPGDEVITTPHTWISTSWAISYVGATPVYADIDPATYNINPELVERAITPRTKVILPVHLYGQAADVIRLREIADRHHVILIEDAAQAHGVMLDGQKVGSFGHAACFSFYPGKNLGAFGEGGAVATDDEQIARRIRCLRDHAQDGRHHHVELGYNTRMEGLQGAVLAAKLPHLDAWNACRRKHAASYHALLADAPGLQLPGLAADGTHVWHLFVVLVDRAVREVVRQELADRGVATGVHYPTPVPLQPVYRGLGYGPGDVPVAADVMARCVSLPMYPELTEEQTRYVANAVIEVLTR